MDLPLIISTTESPALSVVVLHGHAMRPDDLAPFARSIGVPARFVFPQGSIAAAGGGHSWWPIDEELRLASMREGARDLHGLHPPGRTAARATLAALLRDTRVNEPGSRCVLVGFSQGGMLACDALLHEELRVDGLVLMSSSCIALDEWRPRLRRLAGLPVLVTHGRSDADLAFAAGERLRDELRGGGALVDWLAFDGGHETPLPVWRSVRKFLQTVAASSREAATPPV